jgi:hypothetical protein
MRTLGLTLFLGMLMVGCGDATQKTPDASVINDLGMPDYGQPDDGPPIDTVQNCPPGHAFCNGNELLTCKSDGSGYTTIICPTQCDEGECLDACTPGSAQCKTTDWLETCSDDGKASIQFCENGCAGGTCTEVQVCVPDEIFCEPGGARLLKCDSKGSSADNLEECPYGCDEENTACKAAACQPGDTRCADDDPNTVEICSATQTGWEKATTPCKDTCEDGVCVVLACDVDEVQCGPLGVEKCTETQTEFELLEPCKIGCVTDVDGNPACALCAVGEVKCDYQTVKSCDDALEGFITEKECSEIQSCAEGACVDTVTLKEQNPPAANYLLLLKAFVDCWNDKVEGACRAINTTGLTVDISADDISYWFCDHAKEADFDSQDDYAAANDIAGCGLFNVEDMDFQTKTIHGDLNGVECLGYAKDWVNSNEIVINDCEAF